MRKTAPMPSTERLFELYYCDSTSPTGLRHARDTYNSVRKAGDVAGGRTGDYFSVRIDGKPYLTHRLVHKMATGEDFVDLTVDHKNLDRANNSCLNLRWATEREQHDNTSAVNVSGYKGVSRCKKSKSRPWRGMIYTDGKNRSLGYYETPEEAAAVYRFVDDSIRFLP
jgi:hypothetical protein